MTRWIKVPVTKPEDLSLIPEAPWWKKGRVTCLISTSHMSWSVCKPSSPGKDHFSAFLICL